MSLITRGRKTAISAFLLALAIVSLGSTVAFAAPMIPAGCTFTTGVTTCVSSSAFTSTYSEIIEDVSLEGIVTTEVLNVETYVFSQTEACPSGGTRHRTLTAVWTEVAATFWNVPTTTTTETVWSVTTVTTYTASHQGAPISNGRFLGSSTTSITQAPVLVSQTTTTIVGDPEFVTTTTGFNVDSVLSEWSECTLPEDPTPGI
jgi:hypothetical protein